MSTGRAATAASSRRAKQKLVRLLFGEEVKGKGREAHKRLDHAAYSFVELKEAFIQRVHDLHPDKHAHKKGDVVAKPDTVDPRMSSDDSGHSEFVALQEAWRDYEKMAKMMQKVGSGSAEANFTLFGVGCSFSDSPEEQSKRSEIMDMAGRGWLTAGVLPERSQETRSEQGTCDTFGTSLIDDEWFSDETDARSRKDCDTGHGRTCNPAKAPAKKSLVDIPHYLQKRIDR